LIGLLSTCAGHSRYLRIVGKTGYAKDVKEGKLFVDLSNPGRLRDGVLKMMRESVQARRRANPKLETAGPDTAP
jgi:hypothetical protein